MDNDKRICYITYPVLMDEVKDVLGRQKKEELPLYPQGFMPSWFQSGGFPEDDID